MVSRYTAWHARRPALARVCQYELAGLTPERYNKIIQLRHLTNEVFRATVEQGAVDGAFAAGDVNRLVRGSLSLGVNLVRWYRLDGPDSPEQLGDFYAELALPMVMNKGSAEAASAAVGPLLRPGLAGEPRQPASSSG